MTIRDLFAGYKNFHNYDGEFGLEIETETKKIYEIPEFYFWNTHNDNSLRDFGIEYVLKQPIKYEQTPAALEEFEAKTSKIPFIKDSFSTSVHVHVNMLGETGKTLGNFLTTYLLFENLLIRYSGPNRRSNLFCLPVIDAEETFEYARSIVKNLEQKNLRGIGISENNAKYGALNLAALYKYGSLEIRSFRGETDIKAIQEWIDIVNSILTYSRKAENPKAILEAYRTTGIKLKDEVFGKYSKVLSVKDEKEIIDSNAFYAASVAYAVKDWGFIDKKDQKKFNPTKPQLDNYSINYFGKSYDGLTGGEQNLVWITLEREWERGNLITKKPTRKKKDVLEVAWDEVPLVQPQPGGPVAAGVNPFVEGNFVDEADI